MFCFFLFYIIRVSSAYILTIFRYYFVSLRYIVNLKAKHKFNVLIFNRLCFWSINCFTFNRLFDYNISN